jgi:hypothetical protein
VPSRVLLLQSEDKIKAENVCENGAFHPAAEWVKITGNMHSAKIPGRGGESVEKARTEKGRTPQARGDL